MAPTPRLPAFAIALAMAVSAGPALATDSETQFWATGSATVPVASNTSALLMMSQRFRDTAQGGDIWLARGEIDRKLSKALTIGAGATYISVATGHEWRAHQQAVIALGSWQLRSQAEERFVPDAPRPLLRLRQQARYTLPLDPNDRLQLSGEFLYVARTERPDVSPHVDSYRLSAGVQHAFGQALTLTGAYMFIYVPRIGREDHIVHAPQVSLAYRF